MTPEAQRVAIAEACGWQIKQIKVSGMLDVLLIPPGRPKDAMAYTGDLPDYPNDLNAMHEAENELTINQSRDYLFQLQVVARGSISDAEDWMRCMAVIHATAAHRAEAFLRTIGKWHDA